jgi:hypothetical protein
MVKYNNVWLKANLTWHVKKNGKVLDDLCSSMFLKFFASEFLSKFYFKIDYVQTFWLYFILNFLV